MIRYSLQQSNSTPIINILIQVNMLLRQIFALNKPVRQIVFRFSHVSSLFNMRNREHLLTNNTENILNVKFDSQQIPHDIPHQIQIPQQNTTKIQAQKIEDKDIEVQENQQKEEINDEEDKDLSEDEQKDDVTATHVIQSFKDALTKDLSEGQLENFEKLIKQTLKSLRDKNLKETDLLQFFRVIRSYRSKHQNKILHSAATQQSIKLFLTKQKNNKILKSIAQNWDSYDFPTLLKITSLYRYLPDDVIVGSLEKLFATAPTADLGFLKHFDIINEIMNKKDKVHLGELSHKLVKGMEILNNIFTMNYSDLEVVIRYLHEYQIYTSTRMLGGSIFHHLSMMLRPQRKGYKNDFDFNKQVANIYWGCVNLKSKIKVKLVEELPSYVAGLCNQSSTNTETLNDLLDGFFIISNFSNINSNYSRLISEAVSRAPAKQIKTNLPKLMKFLNYLLANLQPEYCLNSMQPPKNNVPQQSIFSTIRVLLPKVIDGYLLQFLKFELDPYVYKAIFRDEGEYEPFLNKYLYLLEHSHDESLRILKHLNRNKHNINPNHPKIKSSLEIAWKKLNRQNNKWPNCLPYYYNFISLAKAFNANLKDLKKHVQGLIPKLEKSQKESEEKKQFTFLVNSKFSNVQYLLPILSEVSPELIKNKSVHKFINNDIIRTIKRWDALEFIDNLKVLVDNFDSLPRSFIITILQNTSVLLMIDTQFSVVHPDLDRNIITKLVHLIIKNYKNIDLEKVDLKVFQMMCVITKKTLSEEDIKKILQILGLKQQKYINQMINFLESYKFLKEDNLKQIAELFPSTFNNITVDAYLKKINNKTAGPKVKNSRQIKKELINLIDKPKKKLDPKMVYEELQTKDEKIYYLINKFYETILQFDSQNEIELIQHQIAKLFPTRESKQSPTSLNVNQEEEKMHVYDQFLLNEKNLSNNKYQLLKMKQYIPNIENEQQFETVDLLTYPIEEEILRNFSRPNYIENEILPKLNDDINKAFEDLKPWFEKVGITAKIRNNAIMLKSRERKNWNKTVLLVVSKPEVFKLNTICVYLINRMTDMEFIVIEEESSVENAIKNFVYKRSNVI